MGDLVTSEWTLAAWFLDHGSRPSDCAALGLHRKACRMQDWELLRQLLEKNLSISTSFHRARLGKKTRGEDRDWILQTGESSARRLDSLLRPIIQAEFPQFL